MAVVFSGRRQKLSTCTTHAGVNPLESLTAHWLTGIHYLCVADNSDDLAVLLHFVEVLVNAGLPTLILPPTRCLGESLLLRAIPFIREMRVKEEYV